MMMMMMMCVFTCLLSRIDETVMLDTDILPRLNYVSMTWNDYSTSDSRSPADMTSVVSAVNAAAIKYLDDRQLVQQAVAAAGRGRNTQSRSTWHQRQAAASASNASVYGVKSANLSLASKKYFEKHGLGASRAYPGDMEPQSAMPRQMSKSKMEDLLNSISSQVNGLQMTMSPRHSTRRNTATDDNGRHFTNSVSSGRRQSDHSSCLSVGNESCQSLPTRQHGRQSADGSTHCNTVLDETCSTECNHYSHHRSSLDGSKQSHRRHGLQPYAVDRTLDFDDGVLVDRTNSLP